MATIRCALRTQSAWDAMSPADQAAYTAHFTSLTDWQTARARDLVSAGDIEQLEVFDDWASGYWEGSVFAFNGTWVTDSSNYIHICAAPGHEARGRKTAGARFIRPDSGTTWSAVFDPSPSKSLVVHWSDLSIINYEPSGIIANFPDAPSEYRRCLLSGLYATLQYPARHKLYCCIVEAGNYAIIDADWNNTANEYENCVFVASDPGAVGIAGGVAGSQRAQNCFFGGFATDTNVSLTPLSSNNASTKAVADDPSITILSVDTSTAFVNYAAEDYHLSSGSVLELAGVNLYDGSGQTDIDGDLWPASGAWNVGIDTQPSSSDTTAPNLSSPTTSSITDTSVVLGATTDEANGIAHAIIVPNGEESLPTNQEIIDGTYANQVAVAADLTISATGAFTFTPTSGLTGSTAYGYAIVHEDAAGNEDAGSRVEGTFTTAAQQPQTQTHYLTAPAMSYAVSSDLTRKVHDLSLDQFKLCLTNSDISRSSDLSYTDDLSGKEIQPGNGYLTGGALLSTSLSRTAGVTTVYSDVAEIQASGGIIGPYRYVAIYNDSSAGKRVVCSYDLKTEYTIQDGDRAEFRFGSEGKLFSIG